MTAWEKLQTILYSQEQEKKKNTKAEEIVSTLQVDTTIEKRHNHAKSPKRFQEL
jgi:hypothetical protein